MAYEIRPFLAGDAPALAVITREAIRAIGPNHYSRDQTDAWAARAPGARQILEQFGAGAQARVAAHLDAGPVAYALLDPVTGASARCGLLYCHPEHTGRGLADELIAAIEQCATAGGAARIVTEASDCARPAFERAGYAVTQRREFAIEHEGRAVAIHNYAMEKPLI